MNHFWTLSFVSSSLLNVWPPRNFLMCINRWKLLGAKSVEGMTELFPWNELSSSCVMHTIVRCHAATQRQNSVGHTFCSVLRTVTFSEFQIRLCVDCCALWHKFPDSPRKLCTWFFLQKELSWIFWLSGNQYAAIAVIVVCFVVSRGKPTFHHQWQSFSKNHFLPHQTAAKIQGCSHVFRFVNHVSIFAPISNTIFL